MKAMKVQMITMLSTTTDWYETELLRMVWCGCKLKFIEFESSF